MSDGARVIADALRRAPLRRSSEAVLQIDIAEALAGGGFVADREASLGPGDRPDFICGQVVIEAKVRYPKRAIYRQLERYAAYDHVAALILVTGTAMGLPAEIKGKPVHVVSLGIGSLGC